MNKKKPQSTYITHMLFRDKQHTISNSGVSNRYHTINYYTVESGNVISQFFGRYHSVPEFEKCNFTQSVRYNNVEVISPSVAHLKSFVARIWHTK